MSLLTIVQGVAKNVGLPVLTQVIGSLDRTAREMAEMADATGEELARRVDWGQLTAQATLTGDGTAKAHALPAGFARLTQGTGVLSGGTPIRPLSQAEWGALTAVEGSPRYFLLREDVVRLWPFLATAQTATVNYQSNNWCDNGTDSFAADDDGPLIDEGLFQKGLEVRWRREKGMDYADHEAEYEAAIADHARFNDGSRL